MERVFAFAEPLLSWRWLYTTNAALSDINAAPEDLNAAPEDLNTAPEDLNAP